VLSSLGSEENGVWFLPKSIGRRDLTYAALPAGVKTIGEAAFDGYSVLTQLRIPPSVTAIGTAAFGRCSHLVGAGDSVWCDVDRGVGFPGLYRLDAAEDSIEREDD
jgi:hypothetical protein